MSKDLIWFGVFIAIFMYGLTVMRIGLDQLSSEKLKKHILLVTNNPVQGLVIGALLTAVLQSSSALMVITIGFVTAGLLSFKQSIGIMLGANIGTTITAELMTIDVGELSLPIVLIGILFILLRKRIFFSIGTSLLGLGCIFVAMRGFTSLADSIYAYPFVQSILLYSTENNLFGVLVGTIMSGVIQSSSAVIGVAMGFLHHHYLTINASIAIMLGANIGTCVTALLASIGTSKEAKWSAYAHVWLNVFGVLLFLPFIDVFSQYLSTLTPSLEKQLAHGSVIFNIACSLLALPFVNLFAKFIMRVYR
ncbi:Na/Pi symporter [Bacillus sp. AK128]